MLKILTSHLREFHPKDKSGTNPTPQGKINVQYLDHNKLIKSVPTSGSDGSSLDYGKYLNEVPNGYRADSTQPNGNYKYSNQPQDAVINVDPNNQPAPQKPQPKPQSGEINVQYVDHGQPVSSVDVSGSDGTALDYGKYLNEVPSGYRASSTQPSRSYKFSSQPQDAVINVESDQPAPQKPQSKPQSGEIDVQYVDHGQPVSSVDVSGSDGTALDYGKYLNEIPSGYRAESTQPSRSYEFGSHPQDAVINVEPIPQPTHSNSTQPAKPASSSVTSQSPNSVSPSGQSAPSSSSASSSSSNPTPTPQPTNGTITVNYVSNGKVVGSKQVSGKDGQPFDYGYYANLAPQGYQTVPNQKGNYYFSKYMPQHVQVNVTPVKSSASASQSPQSSGSAAPSSSSSVSSSSASSSPSSSVSSGSSSAPMSTSTSAPVSSGSTSTSSAPSSSVSESESSETPPSSASTSVPSSNGTPVSETSTPSSSSTSVDQLANGVKTVNQMASASANNKLPQTGESTDEMWLSIIAAIIMGASGAIISLKHRFTWSLFVRNCC